jgi:hypothetical protein
MVSSVLLSDSEVYDDDMWGLPCRAFSTYE